MCTSQVKVAKLFGYNLAVGKAIADPRVDMVLRVCQQVVTKFSQSGKKNRELTIAQHEKQLPSHKLKGDCRTPWGSTLEMKRILEQQEAIRVGLATERKTCDISQDFDVMDLLLAALGPLGELTDALSAEKTYYNSAVCPLLTHLSQEIMKEEDTDSSHTAQKKRAVRVDLESRYGDPQLSILQDVCTYLDP